jgi:hypothetical protein
MDKRPLVAAAWFGRSYQSTSKKLNCNSFEGRFRSP